MRSRKSDSELLTLWREYHGPVSVRRLAVLWGMPTATAFQRLQRLVRFGHAYWRIRPGGKSRAYGLMPLDPPAPLTVSGNRYLDAFQSLHAKHGVAPTVRGLAAHLGVSKQAVSRALHQRVASGELVEGYHFRGRNRPCIESPRAVG